jgi:hypothetical protein
VIKDEPNSLDFFLAILLIVFMLYGFTFLGLMGLYRLGANIPFLLGTWFYSYFFYVRQSVIIMLFTNFFVNGFFSVTKIKFSPNIAFKVKIPVFAFLMFSYMLFIEGLL